MSEYAPQSSLSSLKRARILFDRSPADAFLATDVIVQDDVYLASMERRKRYLLGSAAGKGAEGKKSSTKKKSKTSSALVAVATVDDDDADDDANVKTRSESGALITYDSISKQDDDNEAQNENRILVKRDNTSGGIKVPTPTWHAPWKLATVLSSHLGWVRSIAFDPSNKLFATGSGDRTIKIWNFPKASVGADDALQLTLTGHISPVRGLAFSPRHPYLFSCAEDKQVKCWDLETNQVIRHYHGHLSGVFCLSLHPTLDILVTGGRDAVARVWDMRTKHQIHCLTGHDHTVACLLTKATDPQIITGSHDCTIKLWDLIAGKCQTTLTHHQKSIRAVAAPSFENTFASGAADCVKQWQAKDGKFLKNYSRHNEKIVDSMAVNDDGVLVTGGDDGSMQFWDYTSGYQFQTGQSKVQPGSLEAENGVMAACFDGTGTRLITGEADKTIKIWKEDPDASELTHPIDTKGWRKTCIAQAKQRY
ncbi:Pleiotropic regulator 1 [Seminavis robusta]|uniref:Pleiotropic regulator 1 n=1 Tax=Seminavis robusta TaxID=568900 RepID=A0A9N8DBH3_9STRA|nr:Pleiotropic regulator 1 [Seminavis robusta]|eukprot:Sro69_g038550.1 Pleiotropic regulator 1 (479) ;mRNA; f:55911-57347